MGEDTEVLSEETARECFEVVKKWLGDDARYVSLYPPGHEGNMWVASMEDAGAWAYDITYGSELKWPTGVFVEPVASWCLGLYPA